MERAVCPCCGSEVTDTQGTRELAEVRKCLNLRPTPARMFLALWKANGQVVTHKELFALMEIEGGKPPTTTSVRTAKQHIDRALKELPVKVQSCWGTGYRLLKDYPDWHWRHAFDLTHDEFRFKEAT